MTDEKIEVIKQPKKKAVNGKAKGGGFESTIAKLLSEKFAPLIFRRSQSSGAILGGQNMSGLYKFSEEAKTLFIGDIVPSNESDVLRDLGWKFKRTIECKFYKEADSFSALFKNPQLAGWFEQAAEDASKLEGKRPLLIFKFNHTPVFYAIDDSDERPNNISSSIELVYNASYNGGIASRKIYIGLLNDALTNLEWWKKYESEKS